METNPILKNITDYLIEEVSAEEEELIGASGGNSEDAGDAKNPASSEVPVETDDKLLKVGGACVSVVALTACVRACVHGASVCAGAGQTAALPATGSFCRLLQLL